MNSRQRRKQAVKKHNALLIENEAYAEDRMRDPAKYGIGRMRDPAKYGIGRMRDYQLMAVFAISNNTTNIKKIENNSDRFITRALIHFNNDETLSIIRGNGTYGAEKGLFEVMCNPFFYDDHDPDNEFEDTVRGYLAPSDVMGLIEKIATTKKDEIPK